MTDVSVLLTDLNDARRGTGSLAVRPGSSLIQGAIRIVTLF